MGRIACLTAFHGVRTITKVMDRVFFGHPQFDMGNSDFDGMVRAMGGENKFKQLEFVSL